MQSILEWRYFWPCRKSSEKQWPKNTNWELVNYRGVHSEPFFEHSIVLERLVLFSVLLAVVLPIWLPRIIPLVPNLWWSWLQVNLQRKYGVVGRGNPANNDHWFQISLKLLACCLFSYMYRSNLLDKEATSSEKLASRFKLVKIAHNPIHLQYFKTKLAAFRKNVNWFYSSMMVPRVFFVLITEVDQNHRTGMTWPCA